MNLDRAASVALAQLDSDARRSFASDPLATLRGLGLTVEAVEVLPDSREAAGICDGSSYIQDRVILYRSSRGSRRENFTLGHELGHYLVDQNVEIMDWLADQPNPMQQLEAICDRVAQSLLLPDELVMAHLEGPVRAGSVTTLFDHTRASRPACAIAIAQRLRGLGAVVIFEHGSERVQFSSVHPDPHEGWPEVFPWKGQLIPAGHPLKTFTEGASLTRHSFWETPWGRRAEYYIDAISDGRRVFAVFADTDLWDVEKLHLSPRREFSERPVREVTCCGSTREVRGYPCPECGGGYCPDCRRCRCERSSDRERLCEGCFMSYLPHLLAQGRCESCR